jgi:hypothetical protein
MPDYAGIYRPNDRPNPAETPLEGMRVSDDGRLEELADASNGYGQHST